jgi:hypothetical protein
MGETKGERSGSGLRRARVRCCASSKAGAASAKFAGLFLVETVESGPSPKGKSEALKAVN